MEQTDKLPMIFEDKMPRLKQLMRIPQKKPVYVLVVDDNEYAVIGMRTILGHWNNLGATTTIVSNGQMPHIDLNNHIILIDSDMAGVKDEDIYNWLSDQSYAGIVASTLYYGTDTPARVGRHYRYHFGYKVGIGTSFATAIEFVKFMNELIADAEKH